MKTMRDVKDANRLAGYHFFEPATMRFFKSKVVSPLIAGKYFITTETDPCNRTRFTVRLALEDGRAVTVGEFHQYRTKEDARHAINIELAK